MSLEELGLSMRQAVDLIPEFDGKELTIIHGASLFELSAKSKQEGVEDSKLFDKIGQLQVENDFLKNALSQ